jgi:GxxExxY protein
VIQGFAQRREAEVNFLLCTRLVRLENRSTTENEISKRVVDAAFKIHTRLGPGLLESVYEAVLTYELRKGGLRVERQKAIPVVYEEVRLDEWFRADLVVEDKVIIELKSVEAIAQVHKKQVLTYLRLSNLRLGLLINFGEELIKDGISRVVNGL